MLQNFTYGHASKKSIVDCVLGKVLDGSFDGFLETGVLGVTLFSHFLTVKSPISSSKFAQTLDML